MKKILLILSLILTPIVFSQVVSVSISETYLSLKSGNLNYLSVLKDPDSTSVGITNLKYVLDLNKKTSTVYMDGFKINTINFNTVEKNNNVYVITIKDKNRYDGTLLMTKFTLDTSKNLLAYQWYDKYYDLTIVQTFKQTTVISNY